MSAEQLAGRVRSRTSQGLVYERRGSGRPIVFLHGWCLNGRLWTYEEELLAGSHDVIVPDLPGFGRADARVGPYVLDRYVADVQALLAELDLTDAVLVGFAFGAAVAMGVAAADDSRLAGLVLIGVPSAAHIPHARMLASMRRDWPDFARRSARVVCRKPQSEATLHWLERMFGGTRLPVAVETFGTMTAFHAPDLAALIGVPTLYVHGMDDDFAPMPIVEQCIAVAPDARLATIEDCWLLVPFYQPERFRELLCDFLGEV